MQIPNENTSHLNGSMIFGTILSSGALNNGVPAFTISYSPVTYNAIPQSTILTLLPSNINFSIVRSRWTIPSLSAIANVPTISLKIYIICPSE